MRRLRRLVPLLDRLILRIQASARFLLLRLLQFHGVQGMMVQGMTLLVFAGLKLRRRRGGMLVVGFWQIQNDVKASSSVVRHERRGGGRRDNARPALPRCRSHGGCTSGRGACRSRSGAWARIMRMRILAASIIRPSVMRIRGLRIQRMHIRGIQIGRG